MKITEYGKSMYGGWYANYIKEDGNYDGEHARTLTELCKKLNVTTADIRKARRLDN